MPSDRSKQHSNYEQLITETEPQGWLEICLEFFCYFCLIGFFVYLLVVSVVHYVANSPDANIRALNLSHYVDVPLTYFPKEISVGCATSAYQIEGAWNTDGKGENIWDHLVHQTPNLIKNNDTGDVACDSYHKYKEDVQLIKYIGFNHYRFSVSWSRILPTGHDNVVNQAGIDYYNDLIDQLLANGIKPMVTLYHFDLPQPLQELGGWTNPLMATYFENYARVVFKAFGSKVPWWVTINEPRNVMVGYSQTNWTVVLAPHISQAGVADYLVAHTLLRAHAKAYRLYQRDFKSKYNGQVFITLDAKFYYPKSDSWEDKHATSRIAEFEVGLFAHPIFSKDGDYPRIVRERVDYLSKMEGRSISRLPRFTLEEIEEIRGSSDAFGLNHYTSIVVSDAGEQEESQPSLLTDAGVTLSTDPSWTTGNSSWLKVVPKGMRGVLNYIRLMYNNPPVFITENGLSSNSGLQDDDRIRYHHDYLVEMLLAYYVNMCNVIGYTAWSIVDNFEWSSGYTARFGLHWVDFNDPARPRTKKKSVMFFKQLLATRMLPDVPFEVNKTLAHPKNSSSLEFIKQVIKNNQP
uniref:beta-glucosidase n=1 Tax=Graphocephala atropunctata TaxID=36148 RepID=A0A1B6LLQ7_9HEMI